MMKKPGILYIVPTPIGNLQDITLRAIEVLKRVAAIGAEDTRTSGKLLKHFQIETPMFSYHKFNERARVNEIISRLTNGEDLAIICDAGTPAISDPAKIIIQEVNKQGLKVETLPGATALIPAVVNAAFDEDRFCFNGFLPEKLKDQEKLFGQIKNQEVSQVFYVSPHKIIDFLKSCKQYLGDRECSISREISKIHETHYHGLLSQFVNEELEIIRKGEFVVVIAGSKKKELTDENIVEILEKRGTSKQILKEIATEYNLKRNKLYDLALKVKEQKV